MRPNSRFATEEGIFTEEFSLLNENLAELQEKYKRQDHKEFNLQRFNWADKITYSPVYYVPRMWEFPFAIMETESKNCRTYAVSYTDILAAKDLNRSFDTFRVFIKALLGKY